MELLAERLAPDHRVVNASISGDTTDGGLARLPKTLEVHQPDIVIIELGGNDGLRGYPIRAIRENLRAMTDAVLATGATPVLAGMEVTPEPRPRATLWPSRPSSARWPKRRVPPWCPSCWQTSPRRNASRS